jgi:hypothetical protein
MYNQENELALLLPDIADRLSDYVGIQLDVEDTRIKAASLVAQDLDIKFVITDDNFNRCFEEIDGETNDDYDKDLFKLIVPTLCFFTYARVVSMMQGSYTDSGMSVEEGALSINEAKSASKQYRSIGESYLEKVVEWLEDEDSSTEATMDKSVLRIRSFGGQERTSQGSGRYGIYGEYPTWLDRANYYN